MSTPSEQTTESSPAKMSKSQKKKQKIKVKSQLEDKNIAVNETTLEKCFEIDPFRIQHNDVGEPPKEVKNVPEIKMKAKEWWEDL